MQSSASSVNTYVNCPYSYKLKYVDKVEVNEATQAQLLGLVVHKALSKLAFKQNLNDVNLEKFLSECWNEELMPGYFNTALDMLRNYIACERKRKKGKIKKLFCELFLSSDKYELRGIVDKIEFKDDKKVLCIDYKTNRRMKLDDGLRLQGNIYALLIKENLKVMPSHFYFYFLRFTNKNVIRTAINEKTLTTSLAKIEDVRSKIERQEFDKNESRNCWWCSYRDVCRGITIC